MGKVQLNKLHILVELQISCVDRHYLIASRNKPFFRHTFPENHTEKGQKSRRKKACMHPIQLFSGRALLSKWDLAWNLQRQNKDKTQWSIIIHLLLYIQLLFGFLVLFKAVFGCRKCNQLNEHLCPLFPLLYFFHPFSLLIFMGIYLTS